jgi:hypothetical protein
MELARDAAYIAKGVVSLIILDRRSSFASSRASTFGRIWNRYASKRSCKRDVSSREIWASTECFAVLDTDVASAATPRFLETRPWPFVGAVLFFSKSTSAVVSLRTESSRYLSKFSSLSCAAGSAGMVCLGKGGDVLWTTTTIKSNASHYNKFTGSTADFLIRIAAGGSTGVSFVGPLYNPKNDPRR